MKQKVCKVFIALISLLVLLGGCKTGQQENPSSEVVPEQIENSDIEITKEYLCSEFGIDESEFKGVDFENFVNEFHLTRESVQRENVRVLLQCYKEDYGKIKIPNYREMFVHKSEVQFIEDKQDDISVVIFVHDQGEEQQYYIFDFEIGKSMFGSGSESDVREGDVVGDADETVKQNIFALFEKYDVYSWEQKETKKRDYTNVLGTFESWRLKILFKDDTVYRLHGDGLNDETAPESLDLFLEDLKALAPDSEE